MSYAEFAYLYDELMSDVEYDLWIDLLNKHSKQYCDRYPSRILDLACGTGEVSLRMASLGYQVVGVDLSEDMLTVANAKAMEQGKQVEFYEMNMTEIEGLQSFDTVVIFCDSLNYLQTEDEVRKTFNNVYKLLNEDGLFMFDVHSVYKMENIFKDGTFVSSDEEISYIWNCFNGPYPYSVEHELSFFVKNEQTNEYMRFDETHVQRTFPIEKYKEWLEEIGFEILDISADFGKPLTEQAERIFFTVKK